MIKGLLLFFLLGAILLVSPFMNFGKCLDQAVNDAARMFGIAGHEFNVTFYSGRLLNARGQSVSGTITFEREIDTENERINTVFNIRIRRYLSTPMTIATIFHEFAHAAQYRFNLVCRETGYCPRGYNREQHAELMAFQKMWRSDTYWWNALHMLTMHTFWGKPTEYRAPGSMWRAFFTGANAV